MINIKTSQEIAIMQQGGRILAKILDEVAKAVKPGVTTQDLDKLATQLIFNSGAKPAFLGHDNFPAALCTSINEQIVHGLPLERKLKEGDIIGLDLGVLFPPEKCATCPFASGGCGEQRGLYTDMALTVPVGKVSPEATKLVETARGALRVAVETIKPGRKLSDVSGAIQRFVEKQGLAVIRDLVGHGIGYELHEPPEIPNFVGGNYPEVVLKQGMTLAVEPMVVAGSHRIKKSKDGFGYETEDKSLAAHFEHTVAVTKNGCEVLTKV